MAKFHCQIPVAKVIELSNISSLCCVNTNSLQKYFVKERLSVETWPKYVIVLDLRSLILLPSMLAWTVKF